jgi:hypothetical protein
MIKSVIWSQKEKDTAKQMALDGYTARQIADKIQRSRNAIIGFLHRNKIELGRVNKYHKPKDAPPRPRAKPKLVEKEKPIEINNVSLLSVRTFQCRYIVQESKDPWQVLCCGATTFYKSWCKQHYKIVFRPKEKAA